MLIFNLKKEWFEKIKAGNKTHEYRRYTNYWLKRIMHHLRKDTYVYLPPNTDVEFRLGYPKSTDKNKILKARLVRVRVLEDGTHTDLKCKGKVFDIEFKLIKNS